MRMGAGRIRHAQGRSAKPTVSHVPCQPPLPKPPTVSHLSVSIDRETPKPPTVKHPSVSIDCEPPNHRRSHTPHRRRIRGTPAFGYAGAACRDHMRMASETGRIREHAAQPDADETQRRLRRAPFACDYGHGSVAKPCETPHPQAKHDKTQPKSSQNHTKPVARRQRATGDPLSRSRPGAHAHEPRIQRDAARGTRTTDHEHHPEPA